MRLRINQYRLLVRDLAACFHFYRDVIGLPVSFGAPDEVYASFSLGSDQTLALFQRGLMAEAVFTQTKPAQADAQDAVVLVFEVSNLDEAVKALEAKGVQFVAPATNRPDWGMRTAHFRDPDGNLIEIFHSLPMG